MAQAYISSRCKKILYMIIASEEYVPLQQICEELRLSKRSIYYEICKINDWLSAQGLCETEVVRGKGIRLSEEEKRQIEMAYESKKGYMIEGDCIRIGALFMLYFNMIRPLYESGLIEEFADENKEENLEKLQKIEAELNNSYVDGTLLSLALLIPLMEENNSDIYFTDLKKEELEESQEFILVDKYFPDLCEKEKIYLCLHLLGSRVSVNAVEVFYNESMQSNYEIAKALVAEFEKKACVIFDDKEDLEKALYYHLNTGLSL